MPTDDHPSVDLLRQCFSYDAGRLFWKTRPREYFKSDGDWNGWNARYAGKEAGRIATHGAGEKKHYRCAVAIYHRRFFRYVIVWALHTGEWNTRIDHKDRDSLNDRIENLRIADGTQQRANQKIRSDSSSGFKGVYPNRTGGKWYAAIRVHGKAIRLGSFADPTEAHAAYLEAAKKYFGEFASGG